MSNLTEEKLEAMEARCAAATPGPWCKGNGFDYRLKIVSNKRGPVASTEDSYGTEADADFIAHAREDIPALLAAYRESEAKRKELEDVALEFVNLGREMKAPKPGCTCVMCKFYRKFAAALSLEALTRNDPHTPGPQGPQGGC